VRLAGQCEVTLKAIGEVVNEACQWLARSTSTIVASSQSLRSSERLEKGGEEKKNNKKNLKYQNIIKIYLRQRRSSHINWSASSQQNLAKIIQK